MRLDVYLVKMSFFQSRELAKLNISSGNVLINGKVAVKPSTPINDNDTVDVKIPNIVPYVSLGGQKLEKALKDFQVDCKGMDVLDVGASTGGFTDCALKHGARRVVAVDVGTNQLSSSLQNNPKVESFENTNIKDLKPDSVVKNGFFHLLVADLSFVSLTKIMQHFPQFIDKDGKAILLIKPQFEVGPKLVGKNGLVKDPKAHIVAIDNIAIFGESIGLYLNSLTTAPIYSPKKNIEYLGLFEKDQRSKPVIKDIVGEGFKTLKAIKP